MDAVFWNPAGLANSENSIDAIFSNRQYFADITNNYFAEKGINVNCIKMNGAMEIAPKLEMADKIVDLVSSGKTLIANDLVEIENILEVTSHLVVNRTAFKTRYKNIRDIMTFFREALNEKNS